jgi:hypothetical protein
MALSLDDVLSAPTDPELLNRHLRSLGLVPAPVAQPSLVPPATVSAAMSPVSAPTPAPAPAMKPFVAPTRYGPEGRTPPAIALSPLSKPHLPGEAAPAAVAGPEVAGAAPTAETSDIKPMTPLRAPTAEESIATGIAQHGGTAKEEGQRQFHQLRPQVTAAPDSIEGLQQLRAQQEFDRSHPWGGEISAHPGAIGKIGHVLARIGNIAGDIVAPGTMANIPGTDINKGLRAERTKEELAGAEKQQTVESAEKAREEREKEQTGIEQQRNVLKARELDIMESKPVKPESIDQAAVDAKMKETNPDTKKPYTAYEARVELANDINAGKQNQKTETRQIVGPDGHAHDKVFDITPGSATFGKPLADLGRSKEDKQPSMSQELAKITAGEKLVIATDKDGEAHLMTRAEAESDPRFDPKKIAVATEKDRADGQQNTAALNDMGAKVKNLTDSSKALDQNTFQRGIVATVLTHGPDSLISAAALAGATDLTKRYIQDVASLREAALALPKQTTGGSRVSEAQAHALWNTVPGVGGDSKYADEQLRKFDENLARLWKKVPHMEGQDRERPFGETTGGPWKAPEGLQDPTHLADNKVARDENGNIVARVKGGQWRDPAQR